MDIVFDIDGTLADASHRVHWIQDQVYWVSKPGTNGIPRPNWEMFLSDELVAKDTPIKETWVLLASMIPGWNRIIFITGRPDRQRELTWKWLTEPEHSEDPRAMPATWIRRHPERLYMRKTGDHRPSDIVKAELLKQARADGFNPTMAFEDRIADTAMWRREGLRCFQVAEGAY